MSHRLCLWSPSQDEASKQELTLDVVDATANNLVLRVKEEGIGPGCICRC
jgi:hypothetical protein